MGEEYNVFISWSGLRSKWVAKAMRDWLPVVLQSAKPWMSETDIDKGSRGLFEINNKLDGMKVGITCLTAENMNEPWILYEAGALAKVIGEKTRLCTYLLGGLQFEDVKYPLGMFQATKPDKDDTQRMLRTINKTVSTDPVPERNLDQAFEKMWPDLEETLATMPQLDSVAMTTKRPPDEIMTEILELARGEADSRKFLEGRMIALKEMFEGFMRPSQFAGIFANPPLISSVGSPPYFINPLINNPGALPDLSSLGTLDDAPAKFETDPKRKKKKKKNK